MNSKIRKAVKSGSWYPANAPKLEQLIQSFLKFSSRHLNMDEILKHQCIAAITPHAGLAFSGECATRAYYTLSKKHPAIKTIILFGAVHSYCSSSAGVWSEGEWETPLGNLKIDSELAREVVRLDYASEDFSSHLADNAIELQTPFIKYFFPNVKIVPIATPPSENSIALGEEIAKLTNSIEDEYLIVGSSDLTHYGAPYGFSPAGNGLKAIEWARENDQKLIELIETMKIEQIIPEVTSSHSACGSGAITATVSFAKHKGVTSGITLEHILSYDIMPEDPPELSVGYASIIF